MWEDPAARIRAGMRRRLRRIALACAIAVLAGAGVTFALTRNAPSQEPPIAGDFVAWIDAPAQMSDAPSLPQLATDGVPACLTADLGPLDGWALSTDARLDVTSIYVRVQNLGANDCVLTGRPVARKTSRDGSTIGAPVEPGVFEGTFDDGQETIALRSGESAAAWLSFHTTGCAKPAGGDVTGEVAGVAVEANGKALEVTQGKELFECPALISAWVLDLTGPFRSLRVEVYGGSVKRGSEFQYFVELTNVTKTAVPLQPCPVYTQQLGSLSFTHRLNCERAAIGPGETVRYQMRMPIPDDMPTGQASLMWNIVYGPGGDLPTAVRPF